jgi:hypothetical protein
MTTIRFEDTKPAISNADLLADIKAVAAKLGRPRLSQRGYREHSSFSTTAIKSRFGSWNQALTAAGLTVTHRRDASVDQLFANLMEVWSRLGRQPRKREMVKPLSQYTHHPYVRHFGSWLTAVRQFVASTASAQVAGRPDQRPVARGRREPSLRLRFLVIRRDRFTCKFCGRSPVTVPGLELEVDHIVAWSEGGSTTLENLQTLCLPCNSGKSNLSSGVV